MSTDICNDCASFVQKYLQAESTVKSNVVRRLVKSLNAPYVICLPLVNFFCNVICHIRFGGVECVKNFAS